MALNPTYDIDFIDKLMNRPSEAASHLDLTYVSRKNLSILRVKKGKKFSYLLHKKPLKKKSELKRISALVIPPAWEDVKISSISNAHLQAIGYDLKSRLQYKYHPTWVKVRNRTKFYKMRHFGETLPKIRERMEKDLLLNGWPKNKVMALILKLMEETHIRIGSEQYAKRNKTYGLSTLRRKHIKFYKEKLRFEFTGKKGKKHKITLNNKRLQKLVCKCEEIPGWELFQFFEEDGTKTSVDSGMVNDYIHEISGHLFTAKDFRTWAGTVIFYETLIDLPKTTNSKEIKRNILTAFDQTAKELGNTRNVCRKYYVHPLVVKKYEQGCLNLNIKESKGQNIATDLTNTEKQILKLIQEYKPLKNL
ncbi:MULTISPECIES: DNA topoisomerase IB [Maribacter]|uniref:DNA topoisomerase n=1 Tax=Maribacter flavus TaxID=1658664 RepID=A0ABU7IGD9_9FLAO|nr:MULTISPECIES: DNA topoisomerase IB [Maribacter]MDC6405237.1 DNA topoisomerase IB [Maribacter sp. PR66]MEE1971954.1 DNA topoisomerase IB [Maribacter flavus]